MGWTVKEPCVIYAIRCSVNGKVYVGRTQNLEQRLRQHMTELRNRRKTKYGADGPEPTNFQRDFDQYGEKSFEFYVLEENVAPQDAQATEARWIEEYNATDPLNGYNRCSEKPAMVPDIKKGLPPKRPTTDSVYRKFAMLTARNQAVVVSMIETLLEEQARGSK